VLRRTVARAARGVRMDCSTCRAMTMPRSMLFAFPVLARSSNTSVPCRSRSRARPLHLIEAALGCSMASCGRILRWLPRLLRDFSWVRRFPDSVSQERGVRPGFWDWLWLGRTRTDKHGQARTGDGQKSRVHVTSPFGLVHVPVFRGKRGQSRLATLAWYSPRFPAASPRTARICSRFFALASGLRAHLTDVDELALLHRFVGGEAGVHAA
jgi:hypothetical protein